MELERLTQDLMADPTRNALIDHPFFTYVSRSRLTREELQDCISQWWHPLQYFPTFLSRTISNVPWLTARSSLSKILYQELGEGDAGNSHEGLFLKTMLGVGFTEDEVAGAKPSRETQALVDGMGEGAQDGCWGLGYVYGIEVVDLPLVSWVGKAITGSTGETNLPWVEVHLSQEGDHVENVRIATDMIFTDEEAERVRDGARRMWRLWHGFFDGLYSRLDGKAAA